LDGEYRAICFVAADPERLASSVQSAWINAFGEIPLAMFEEGWFAFVSTEGQRKNTDEWIQARLRHFTVFRVRIGTSRKHEGEESPGIAIREAWLAARVTTRELSPLGFDSIDLALLPRLMPSTLAKQLLGTLYPDFANDNSMSELSATVLTFLDCQGSIT